ncbi:mitochondrial RNA pseudouridine synthase rpusd4-like [Siniperca chuatsi]|uniref:mitochondrial RNA pseudouridine synthase rpusd4-like n=1 Tax=Siniperca chuatsi TaxID=119488 RepID=UPI001CE13E9B|nr:mitochondrial RNA pseudouridine synthase rpusd4-like [Siniperca chuatsi]XP_044070086.1 mitochondrial RNA pseudouridine synthase rpusd4-like [Siniperca chuatsi]
MNSCRRIACREWKSGLNIVFSRGKPRTNCRRCSEAAPALSRSQATAAKHAPGSDTGEKPRLRAIDLARKVQQERAKPQAAEPEKLSGQHNRVTELKRFSLQLQNVHPNVLAKHLHRGVLYQDKDVVVINKPYGVPVRDDSGVTSISSVLPVLSKMMAGLKIKSGSQLLPCLGLEKDISGALLLARSEEVAEHVLSLNRNNQVQRKFWVITVGVPVPSEGVIDIPIIEREVTGSQPHYKMALSPLFRMNDAGDGVTKVRAHRQAHPAVTRYRVLDSSSGCSLVELQPLTGVKHQMRVHMAFALTCPILGDHKYSHWSKLAPQKLPERVLGKLGLEQSKIRYLPLHLLAQQLILPGTSQADISVSCPLPKYFIQTLNRLQLTLPDKKDYE